MTLRALTIALFSKIHPLPLSGNLIRIGNIVKECQSLANLRYAEDIELMTFDALLLTANSEAEAKDTLFLLAELRRQPDLFDMPLVILANQISEGTCSRMYLEYADAILHYDSSASDINLLFRSLVRKRIEKQTLLEAARFSEDKELAFFKTYEGLTEPVIVFRHDHVITWLNSAATSAFGIADLGSSQTHEFLDLVSEKIKQFLIQSIQDSDQANKINSVLLESLSGNSEWWNIKVIPIVTRDINNKNSLTLPTFVVYLKSKAKLKVIENRAHQLAQLEAMSLRVAACAHTILEKTALGIVVSPYMRISEHLNRQDKICSINAVITSLLEYLDPVLSQDIKISVRIDHKQNLAMPFGDAFELVGHMLFNAINFVFTKGDITIESGSHEPGKGTTVLITANSPTRARLVNVLSRDFLKNEMIITNPELKNIGGELPSRFTRARDLTTRYRTELLFQTKSDDTLKLKVALPSANQ